MAGFPVAGEKGIIDASGTTNTADIYQLFNNGIRPFEFEISAETPDLDTTALSTSVVSRTKTPGLNGGSTRFRGYYPQTTPRIGNQSLIATGGSPTTLVRATEFELNYSVEALDITALNGTPPTWRVFRPGDVYMWGGSYTQLQESGTAGDYPALVGDAAVAYVFSLLANGTDSNKWSGSVHRLRRTASVRRGSLTENKFSFTGTGDITETLAGTAANAPGLFGTTSSHTIGTPSWDLTSSDGTPDVVIVHQLYTSRLLTVPVFLESLSVKASLGALLEVSGVLRWAGAPSAITA